MLGAADGETLERGAGYLFFVVLVLIQFFRPFGHHLPHVIAFKTTKTQ